MKLIFNKYRIIFSAIICLVFALVFENNSKRISSYESDFNNAQEVLNKKIVKVENILRDIEYKLDSLNLKDLMKNQDFIQKDLYPNEGIVILGFSSDSLVFWSDNSIPIENYLIDNALYNRVSKFRNGWFVIRQNYIENYEFFGLILIKNEYSYQNEFIKNDFFYEYKLNEIEIVLDSKRDFKVNDYNDDYLFSFVLKSGHKYYAAKAVLASLFYFIALVLILLYIRNLVRRQNSYKSKGILLFILGLGIVCLRYCMLKYHFPRVFNHLDLFQPHHFGISFTIPSLGDLLIHSMLILCYFFIISESFRGFKITNKRVNYVVLILFVILSFIFFSYVNYIFKSLVFHSSISFDVYKFLELSIYSFVGFLIILFLQLSIFLFINRYIQIVYNRVSWRYFFLIIVLLIFALGFISQISSYKFSWFEVLFYLFLTVSIFFIKFKQKKYSYSLTLLFLLLLVAHSVLFITGTSLEKDTETRKVLAVNLSNERDQIAEMLLVDVEQKIQQDTVVRDLLEWHLQNKSAILEHLQINYFSGYFRKFDLKISVCKPDEDLTLIRENTTEIVPCYRFFKNLSENEGLKLNKSNFHFIDNLNGKISYLGKISYQRDDWDSEISLFISLDSKLISQELGYPELLLDNRMSRVSLLSNYSYAKYKEGYLTTQSGIYSYQLSLPNDWISDDEFYDVSDKEFNHLIYRINDDTVIVISNLRFQFVDLLASLSYIFVLYYIIFAVTFFIIRFPDNIRQFNYDFKNKIKFSMIGVLLLSLIVIGIGTTYYSINQFQNKLHNNISEKLQSVLVEVEHKLGGEFSLDSDYSDYLTYLLTKFSNVFYIDINMYDVKGNLLASSRPQIFEKGLMGRKMNNIAYDEMLIKKRGRFIHKETIGKLSYYSAYVPFMNENNELLAYINLPYFTKQSALKKEIYTIVIAIVNIYFFLILLSVIVAILVSNNITKPLQLINERFKSIDLIKHNKTIEYENKDEIGSLIKEYNRMVTELRENAEKLAKSERESAWREMAKQIAHEIKNPLTPMKLSVQYLQKAWVDKIPDFDKRLSKFSNSLISQINSLSRIATEFSNFAKMPKASTGKVDIVEKLVESINLFETTENVEFITNVANKQYYVNADKEQLLIIIGNLIKNGIQAIPKGKQGIIDVKVKDIGSYIELIITDNGAGIANEVRDKLFIPNFTTKTSGMGLGLAIVKNMLENIGGRINYKTKIGEGTSFFVLFPKYEIDL
ncbi:MAG: ATP-binding protein [Bacteroidales bacterium]|nr:ATP-binding protein [Bacteroidales bacterium]